MLLAGTLLAVPSAPAQLSEQAQMSLITIYPGEAVYSLWGHSALRVHDPVLGFDIAYNYGTFNFGNPLVFAARFAYGKLDYSLSRQHYPALADQAQNVQGRTTIEQHLRLSSEQKNMLFQFLEHNALPENRTYRYDFLFDNCSTRIRDLFVETLGIPLPSSSASDHTYRALLHPYAASKSLLSLGINLGMGLPADELAADRTFLPLELMDVAASMHSDSGTLVARTDTVYLGPNDTGGSDPWATVAAWLALGLGIWITLRGKARAMRYFDRVCYTTLGAAGLLIAFLWLVSLHNVTQPNLHAAWLWPTHMAVAWWRPGAKWLRIYHSAAAAMAAVFVLAVPLLPQSIPSAALPLIILIALRSGYHALQRAAK